MLGLYGRSQTAVLIGVILLLPFILLAVSLSGLALAFI